ncbi:hypothetical protein QYE76_016192 [Lolium multiflorum]|uniref:Uncharacterized protein n=1 Tax=Lolium multiflorum TaxID=4521 RepID=A0AAD8U8A7_LOLMU|nr:hypothetical protein QYE76_016192 [Lolium multiflorum]
MYAGEEDVDRVSKDLSVKDLEKLIRRFSSLSKKNEVPTSCRVEPYSGSHNLPENHQILSCLPPLPGGGEVELQVVVTDDPQDPSRPESEVAEDLERAEKRAEDVAAKLERSEKAREKAEQEAATVEDLRQRVHKVEEALSNQKKWVNFTLHEAEEDRLLDTLSILELHGDLARCVFKLGRVPRASSPVLPQTAGHRNFSELARRFLPEEDLSLAYRQENLKVGLERTIALVADSHQTVDWGKVGDPKGMNMQKWKSLVKAAKPHSKKILSFLGHKPSTSTSTAKPEVK